jgi:hypothetical protein
VPGLVAPKAPPDELQQGAAAYFEGQYDQAIKALSGMSLSGPKYRTRRLEAQRNLFLAAAAYGMYRAGGATDVSARNMATAAARECLDNDPDVEPDPAVFSPRFRLFFEAQR